jgi:hypothetical protein
MIFCSVGILGMGKTTLTREFMDYSKKEKLVYTDKPHDFTPTDLKGKKNFKNPQKLWQTNNFEEFVSRAVNARNTICVVADAANCIPRNAPDPKNIKKVYEKNIMVWLANSRDANNLLIFEFHDFSELPVWLLKKGVDYLFRFQTNDQYNVQATRFSSFPNIVKSFENDYPKGWGDFKEIKVR